MSAPPPSPAPEGQKGLIGKLADLLFSSGDPEREKRRLLKNIEKEIRSSKTRFYNHRNGTAEPQLAGFFHTLYRTLGPARALLEGADTSDALRGIIIESHLPQEYVDIRNGLAEEEIRRRALGGEVKSVADGVKDELRQFSSAFTADLVKTINSKIAQMAAFLDLVNYDYYAVLRRFDPQFPEGSFSYTPSFGSINAEYVADDLKDFLEVVPAIDARADWEGLLDRLKEYRHSDAVPREEWRKSVRAIGSLQESKVLLNIVRLIDKSPFTKVQRRSYRTKSVEDYLQKIKVQAELALQKCARQKQSSKIQNYLMKAFGSVSISRLKMYTEKSNEMFSKRMLSGFTHVDSLNYVLAYFQDHLSSETKDILDLLIIKGRWVAEGTSRVLSDTFRTLITLSDDVAQFDASLDENEGLGKQVKMTLAKAERDRAAQGQLRQLLRTINDTAGALVESAGQHLMVLGKSVKAGIDDFGKSEPAILANWKELDSAAEGKLKARLVGVYTRIYFLVQLLRLQRQRGR